MVIDLSSDTQTKPSAGMRKAMYDAEVGDEQSQTDPTVNALQELVADLTGKDAALFMPSGTMCNLVAVTAHTRPGDIVILDRRSHIALAEGGAAARFAGGMMRPVAGDRGVFTAEQVAAEWSTEDTHRLGVSLICVENTHNQGGGKIWPVERLAEIKVFRRRAQDRDPYGWRAPDERRGRDGVTAKEYASYVDTVWIDLSKGLGAPVGAVLAGSHDFIHEARLLKHRYGGAMRQAGVIAAAGLYGFEHYVERLAEDHHNAKLIEAGLAEIPGIELIAGPVETNLIFFDIAGTGITAGDLIDRLLEYDVRLSSPYRQGSVLRMVTHLDVTTEQCKQAVEAVRKVVSAA
ncbi:MAG: GntG family PLP-dependent aldolase [Thermomicrobiales bacterium]